MFETSKHVPETEKRCCVFKDNCSICANKAVWINNYLQLESTDLKLHDIYYRV